MSLLNNSKLDQKKTNTEQDQKLYELYRIENANPKERGEKLLKNAHLNKVIFLVC